MGDGDEDGRIFPLPEYGGTGDGVYIGGVTNDALTRTKSPEPSPMSIAACSITIPERAPLASLDRNEAVQKSEVEAG